MTEISIDVRDLTKAFGRFTAVDHVTFAVRRGEIFGFLGANGAGKSTTIRMLCGLLGPTSGSASVGGFDIAREPDRVKARIGYMSQKFSLYEDLTVEENIEFFGGVYGVAGGRHQRTKLPGVLEMAGLEGRERSLARELSVGWKQRLALGCALLHEPRDRLPRRADGRRRSRVAAQLLGAHQPPVRRGRHASSSRPITSTRPSTATTSASSTPAASSPPEAPGSSSGPTSGTPSSRSSATGSWTRWRSSRERTG